MGRDALLSGLNTVPEFYLDAQEQHFYGHQLLQRCDCENRLGRLLALLRTFLT